jgi:tetratricopeptide (TPR) repeat protein
MNDFAAAEFTLRRAIRNDEKGLPPDSPDLGADLHNLGSLYFTMRRYQEAAPLLQRALDIRTKALGLNDRDTIQTLETYANLLHYLHRDAEAKELESKVKFGNKTQ